MMEYMARFTELARFGDDYVATDMVKVRRFENGLKLFIRGKIVGLRLQDMDSMVWTKERDGGRIGHSGCECWWEKEGGSAFFYFGKETEDFCPTSVPGTGLARADDMLLFPSTCTYEAGLPTEAWISRFWVPSHSGMG